MWTVTNKTPFAAERCWVRDKDGAEVWLVAVKGTFIINVDGTLRLADEQEPVRMPPEFRGDPAETSLLYDSDLPHKKSATDVLVNGHAYAPGGRPTTEVNVSLKVGPIDKTLTIVGDRTWQSSMLGLAMSEPEPFQKMPIVYERAFGGTDLRSDDPKQHAWEPSNPVGRGFATERAHLIDQPAPNVEASASRISSWTDRPPPVGFGPVAAHWKPRVSFGGTYDDKWQKERLPLLPDDFDERFHQCAPLDQQVPGFLRGGEEVELRNMTPRGTTRFRLPRVTLNIQTQFDDGDHRDHRAVLHTVAIEPDVPRVMLVWHTHLECHHKVLKLWTTRLSLKQRINVSDSERNSGLWVGA